MFVLRSLFETKGEAESPYGLGEGELGAGRSTLLDTEER